MVPGNVVNPDATNSGDPPLNWRDNNFEWEIPQRLRSFGMTGWKRGPVPQLLSSFIIASG
jgi:hypothetical protein